MGLMETMVPIRRVMKTVLMEAMMAQQELTRLVKARVRRSQMEP